MDSLTHIVLGACMGEAFAGKKLGKKAMLWGALSQSIPDIDFLTAFWMDTSSVLLAHRGFTHSILFCLLTSALMTWAAERWHRPHNISAVRWMLFFSMASGTHILSDAFNNYGVGWFEPFSHQRISFNAVHVADPFFSIWPALAFLLLLWLRKWSMWRRVFLFAGLGMSTLYLGYCLFNKSIINSDVKKALKRQHISYTNYFTTPAPLQSWLWYIVVADSNGFHTGYHSVFDSDKELHLHYFPQQKNLLNDVKDTAELQRLIRFSKGYYTAEKWNDTLVFNDLRFGQEVGWYNPTGRFAFHYFLGDSLDNHLVVQRGRFAGWNAETFRALIQRIKGTRKSP